MPQCDYCQEYRFKGKCSLQSHLRLNHFRCRCKSCLQRFRTAEELKDHINECSDGCHCKCCCKGFRTDKALMQHRSVKDHGDRDNDGICRCQCGEEFSDEEDLEDHQIQKKEEISFIPCLTCAATFSNIESLKKHQKDTYHYKQIYGVNNVWEVLYAYFDAYFKEKVMLNKHDRKKSRIVVQKVLNDIMSNIRNQTHGNLFTNKLVTAGSTSTQTKVGKADEFDFNLPLSISINKIRSSGEIVYQLTNRNTTGFDKEIPIGYCVVNHGDNVPRKVREMCMSRDIIPIHVQEHLSEKIQDAIENLKMSNDVSLRNLPHGPALTIIIRNKHDHNISVDIAASIDVSSSIDVTHYGWPRFETKRHLSKDVIKAVIDAGVHLVPKKSLFWYISFSKAARVLLNMIDAWDECRRKCHMMIKKDFQTWVSKFSHGFAGISTYIFKHHLFWMNEWCNRPSDYWKNENIGQCYCDILNDLASHLRSKKLMNYFNTEENILENKDKSILTDLANCMLQRRQELLHIKII